MVVQDNINHHIIQQTLESILLRRFLQSAAKSITEKGIICVTTVNSPYYDGAFAVDEAAQWAGLTKPFAYAFDPGEYLTYQHSNTLNPVESALAEQDEFVTFVFRA